MDLRFSFSEWKHRAARNPDGYGFAYWPNGSAKIEKDATSLFDTAQDTGTVERIASRRSQLFLCHVRLASAGELDGSNTHPFVATAQGREWVFAHNGTLHDLDQLELTDLVPEGETDSELAFLWILENMTDPEADGFSLRLKELAEEVSRLGNFNFLLSDSKTMWAYADTSLYVVERTPPYGGELVRLLDAGSEMSLKNVKRHDERAALGATEPLTNEPGWTRLAHGELVEVRDGKIWK